MHNGRESRWLIGTWLDEKIMLQGSVTLHDGHNIDEEWLASGRQKINTMRKCDITTSNGRQGC